MNPVCFEQTGAITESYFDELILGTVALSDHFAWIGAPLQCVLVRFYYRLSIGALGGTIATSVKVTSVDVRQRRVCPEGADGLSTQPEEVPSDKARHWKGTLEGCRST